MTKKVSIIVPIYNEKENISLFVQEVNAVMSTLPYNYTITFINDGSNDGTLEELKLLASISNSVTYISLSRNFGHQNALKAGIDYSDADCVISMDGDLQHPPRLIPELIKEWENGHDIVYTIRKDDKDLPALKRSSSKLFYNSMNRLSDVELENGTADFRLMDRKVVDVFKTFKEDDLFWRGLVKWLGFKQIAIEYSADARRYGVSKYSYKKMMLFGLRGFTSFSVKPLYVAVYLGFVFALLSLLYIPVVVYDYFTGHTVSGWATIIVAIAFFGGLQLIVLGIIGIYIGKLFMQSKQRPHYIISESNL